LVPSVSRRKLPGLGEGLEAVALDRAEMHENILAVVGGDESIPLASLTILLCPVLSKSCLPFLLLQKVFFGDIVTDSEQ
jgi:hypothetical protein